MTWVINWKCRIKKTRSAYIILKGIRQTLRGTRCAGVGLQTGVSLIMEIEDCQRQFSRVTEGTGLLPYLPVRDFASFFSNRVISNIETSYH